MHDHEKGIIQELPSIDLNTSKKDLFDSYLRINALQSELLSTYQKHMSQYFIARLAIDAGIPVEQTPTVAFLNELLSEPPSEKYTQLLSFWFQLNNHGIQLPFETIEKNWKDAISTIQDPLERMNCVLQYIYIVSPESPNDVWNQKTSYILSQFAQQIRKEIPTSERFTNQYVGNTYFYVQLIRSLRHIANTINHPQLTNDLDRHLVQSFEKTHVEEADSFTVQALIAYVVDTTSLSSDQKQKMLQEMYQKISLMSSSDRQDRLLGAVTRGFLTLNDFSLASKAWQAISDHREAVNHVHTFIIWGAKHKTLDQVRKLFPKLYSNLQQNHPLIAQKYRLLHVSAAWLFAAKDLAAEGISIVNEPEIIAAIQSTSTTFLTELVALVSAFPHEHKFRSAVRKSLQKHIIAFNRGELETPGAENLFEAMLNWK